MEKTKDKVSCAYKEIYEILKIFPKELVDRIPKYKLDYIKQNMDESYEYNITKETFDGKTMLDETAAILAILCTVFNQMMTEDLQKTYELNGQELQLAIAPSEFLIGVIASIIFEARGPDGFLEAKFSRKSVLFILGTCFFAIGVNLSTFSLIGKTSSVSYQVIGHFKTVLLLVFGYIFFPSKWKSSKQMYKAYTGIVIALLGVFCYTKAKLDAQKTQESLPSALRK